jgi:hypothetical protein
MSQPLTADDLPLDAWLIKLSDATFWRIDDKYQAGRMWIFYLAPQDAPHRSEGALYELAELAGYEVYPDM